MLRTVSFFLECRVGTSLHEGFALKHGAPVLWSLFIWAKSFIYVSI